MSKMNVEMGKIIMVDTSNKNGVIQSKESGQFVYFQLNDVEMGVPKEGEAVQFMMDTSSTDATAKKIVVLADAARKSLQSKR